MSANRLKDLLQTAPPPHGIYGVSPSTNVARASEDLLRIHSAVVHVEIRNKYEIKMPEELSSKLADAIDYATSDILAEGDLELSDSLLLQTISDHLATLGSELDQLHKHVQGALSRMDDMDHQLEATGG